jgi:SSS family transporter
MSLVDWLVIALYFAVTLGMSAMLARGQHSTADYYVGGRALPWWALAVSTLATQSSANSFIGIPAFVALVPGGGLSWLQYELMVPLAMAIVCVLLVPVLRGMGLISVYEYLERRFDRRTRLVLSAVFLLSRGLATGVALYAAAVLVEVCTGLPLAWCIALMGVVTVIYDCMGGMRAVVWTDVMQMVVLLGGVIACIVVATGQAGGIDAALALVPADRLDALEWSHGLGDEARAPLWGVLVGGLVLYVSYYGVDQSQVQRQLSADSIGSAQKALVLNGMARFPLTLLYAALGVAVCAVYALQEPLRAAVPAGRPDYLIPRYIQLYLPAGIRGLLVAAILAAAMSSLDSALNSLSASTMRDFVEPYLRQERLVWASRMVTGAWGVAIIAFGLSVGGLADNVVEGINRIGALFYGPLLAAFACGILDRRARGPGVLAGVAAGLAINLLLAWAVGPRVFWMWWNVSGLVVAIVVTMAVSRLMPAAGRASLSDIPAQERLLYEGARARRLVLLLVAYTLFISVVLVGLDRYA